MAQEHANRRGDSDHVAKLRDLAMCWVNAQSVVSAYISANVVDSHHGEDILQEVAQVCAEKFDEFDGDRSFASWAMGIARHRILKYYRTRSRDRMVLCEAALVRLEASLDKLEPHAEERREALRACMRRIEGRRRKVLDLRYGESARVADVATQCGMSPSAVSVMLHHVRSELLNCIQRKLAGEGV